MSSYGEPFELITTPVPRSTLTLELMEQEFEGCTCTVDGTCEDNECECIRLSLGPSYREHCFNLDLDSKCTQKPIVECHQHCGCGARCSNRLVGLRPCITDLQCISMSHKGFGLICTRLVKKGEYVGEYLGELLSPSDAQMRFALQKGLMNNYLMIVKEHFQEHCAVVCIDARLFGNMARFINHSCEPNLVGLIVRIGVNIPRLGLFAKTDIPAGQELTYNYGHEESTLSNVRCLCASQQCRGFMPLDFL